jgi:hypothetical protein
MRSRVIKRKGTATAKAFAAWPEGRAKDREQPTRRCTSWKLLHGLSLPISSFKAWVVPSASRREKKDIPKITIASLFCFTKNRRRKGITIILVLCENTGMIRSNNQFWQSLFRRKKKEVSICCNHSGMLYNITGMHHPIFDWTIIGFYMIVSLAISLYFTKRASSSSFPLLS